VTYTFLFTDIAGHTPLWDAHPAEMSTAVADYEQIVDQAVVSRRGRVVKHDGDGVMAVFRDTASAVDAACAALAELNDRRWSGIGALSVRMGLHAGSAELRDGDYYGPTVIRAARLAESAHGGQLVASASVVALTPDVAWTDLGEYRLRGLHAAERIHQVASDRAFPPLR
jgi:class 3 adenylate cyclase